MDNPSMDAPSLIISLCFSFPSFFISSSPSSSFRLFSPSSLFARVLAVERVRSRGGGKREDETVGGQRLLARSLLLLFLPLGH